MNNPFRINDVFVSICYFLHWRDINNLKISCKFFQQKIKYNYHRLIPNVYNLCKEYHGEEITGANNFYLDEYIYDRYMRNYHCDDNDDEGVYYLFMIRLGTGFFEMLHSHKYFYNCYNVDLSSICDLSWTLLLHFDNCCHYLSLRGTNTKLEKCFNFEDGHKITDDKLVIDSNMLKFLKDNFDDDDIQIHLEFTTYNDSSNLFHYKSTVTDSQNYLYHPSYLLSLKKNSLEYQYIMEWYKNKIDWAKQEKIKYKQLKKWFSTAQIDEIDLSCTNVGDNIIYLLTGCKKVTLCGVHTVSQTAIEYLRKNGVKVIM